ncbi:uncharacterized protein TNIN_448351 [Trichonephila inaurata madagascariensis]|uniref:Uncharacterized protein n=1 Tax=Trichonephila inaurata madagascariensis TaxID=2747483 RepID=A0A8X6WWX9_9ARAC|nr:uncharacterized protein TNIN_448351 [Trichonephila inaurata madagascariensis]
MADSFQKNPKGILLGANFLVNTITGKPRKINKNLFVLPSPFWRNFLMGQLPYSRKVKNAAVFNISCRVVESDLERLWGLESFLLEEELTKGYAKEHGLNNFGKEVKKKKWALRGPVTMEDERYKRRFR